MKKFLFSNIKYIFMIILGIILLISNVNAQNTIILPFIGSIVNIDNLPIYFQSGNNELDAIIPKIQYNKKIDTSLNKEINEFTEKIITDFFNEYNEENHHYTKIDYDVITDTEEWFTLKLNVLDTMASNNSYSKYYHIDKIKNDLINLDDLFAYKEYKYAIIKDIKKQMIKRIQEDNSLIYWTNDNYPKSELNDLDNDQNFYFNKLGNLVIVFNEFEVGPGYIGPQEFIIDFPVYKKYLKTTYIR